MTGGEWIARHDRSDYWQDREGLLPEAIGAAAERPPQTEPSRYLLIEIVSNESLIALATAARSDE